MTDHIQIRPAETTDEAAIIALLPQLADFEVPENRNPDDLWQGDADMVSAVLAGSKPETFLEVAVADDKLMGVIMVTMREELMSHAPSAHLEAIVVHPDARGQRLGQRLLERSEEAARERGATSLSLHVFSNNHRARGLYRANGFDEELIRATKWFSDE